MLVEETMPKDNLLNSACLEFFEFLMKEGIKQLIVPLVETYRDRLSAITYVGVFHRLIEKYEQLQAGYHPATDDTSFSTQAGTPNRVLLNGTHRWSQGLKDNDAEEDAYFNTSDGEDEEEAALPTTASAKLLQNGTGPARPLVAYPDDEEDAMDVLSADRDAVDQENAAPASTNVDAARGRDQTPVSLAASPGAQSPPERLSEKRRREEDDEDDLNKMVGGTTPSKRRNSAGPNVATKVDSPGLTTASPNGAVASGGQPMLRRKGSLRNKDAAQNKLGSNAHGISITLKSSGGGTEGDGGA